MKEPKQTNLETYCRNHEQDFRQIEQIDADYLWTKIHPQLADPKTGKSGWNIQLGLYWKVSVAATVTLLIGLLSWQSTIGPAPGHDLQLADYFPELAEEEKSYQRLIQEKEQELQLSQLDHRLYQDLMNELALLDQIHQEYLQDLPAFQDQEALIKVLMRYYEQRIRLLEQLAKEIQKQKNNETDQNDLFM